MHDTTIQSVAPDARRTRGAWRSAFTVVELLVVVVIILIVLTVATPAFRALIYSSQRSESVNALNAAVVAGRELALRSGGNANDAAVVFLFDRDGSMRLIPAVKVGSVQEPVFGTDAGGGAQALAPVTVTRDVFAPSLEVASFEMPEFWNVRGYAPVGSMVDFVSGQRPNESAAVWYNSPAYGGDDPRSSVKTDGNWIFPETAFYDIEQANAPAGNGTSTARQSFMIRFDARTGAISQNRDTALFVDPRPSTVDRPGGENRPPISELWQRPDRAENLADWARSIVGSQPVDADRRPLQPPYRVGDPRDVRASLIGLSSNDTVLVKPVTRVAVYDERRMAPAIGARRLNPVTNSLYLPVEPGDGDRDIVFDESLFDGIGADEIRVRINRWMDGDTNNDGDIDDEDEVEARLYIVRQATGELAEVLR